MTPDGRARAAGEQLLACYAQLAAGTAHLLDGLVEGRPLVHWEHYPAEDAIDRETGYQYFYHCHAPGRRRGGAEHGHFHLFARLDSGRHRLDQRREARFLAACGSAVEEDYVLAHLIAIGLDQKGVPRSVFTVNQWVTGDRLLSAPAVLRALAGFELRTAGDPLVNRWLAALLVLFRPQIENVLAARDRKLRAAAHTRRCRPVLQDHRVEVLSTVAVDIDAQLDALDTLSAAG